MFKSIFIFAFSFIALFSAQSYSFAQSNQSVFDKLSQIFEPEIQGTTIAYLETIIGPPKKIDQWSDNPNQSVRHYQIGPCKVTVTGLDVVINIKLEKLSKDCSFDLRNFDSNSDISEPVSIFGMTFADLNNVIGASYQFIKTCIYMCGNSGSPDIGFDFQPHFPELPFISASFNLNFSNTDENGRETLDQLQILKDYLIKTQGDETVALVEYEITPEANELAWESLKDVYFDSILIGVRTE
jgi:hypothetical protein